MAAEAGGGVGRAHPAPVVLDLDELAPGPLQRHLDARGAGVEGVLDELLERVRRPLHDLAGGDLARQRIGERPDEAVVGGAVGRGRGGHGPR